jgi:rhodanese-related sulfurtransferase
MLKIMKKILLIPALLAVWDLAWPLFGVRQIPPWSLQRMMQKSDASEFVLLDVRTRTEYDWLHIPGALHMPELLLHPEALPGELARKRLVVICMTGHRSPVTAYRLHKIFSADAANLTWGMAGWIACGGEVRAAKPK